MPCFYVPAPCSPRKAGRVKSARAISSQAWNRGDIDGYMLGYWKSDSLVFVGKTAPVYGWQSTLERYKKAYPGKAAMGELTFDILQVKILDDR